MRLLIYTAAIVVVLAAYGVLIERMQDEVRAAHYSQTVAEHDAELGARIENLERATMGVRYCDAPCVVVLPPGTLEDEFWFDYGWHRLRDADGRHRSYPVVGVYAQP